MQRIRRLSAFAWIAAVAVFGSAPAMAELAQWDQARVTEIGKQLATATDGFEQAVRQAGGGTVGDGAAEDEFGVANKARVLREMSTGLAAHLAKGEGYDETHDLYRSLKEVVDDTQVQVKRSPLQEPVMDAWAKVADAMRQIAPYYDPKADAE